MICSSFYDNSVIGFSGCSGALAKQCVSIYPTCKVTIFDLPKVVKVCRDHFLSEENERILFHEGKGHLHIYLRTEQHVVPSMTICLYDEHVIMY